MAPGVVPLSSQLAWCAIVGLIVIKTFFLTLRFVHPHAQGVLYKTGPPNVSSIFCKRMIRVSDVVVMWKVVCERE